MKPEDIPEDAWLMATDVMHEHHLKTWARNQAEWDAHILIGARAILAERERCAKVADTKHGDETDDEPWSSGWRVACNNIAAAIRKGSD